MYAASGGVPPATAVSSLSVVNAISLMSSVTCGRDSSNAFQTLRCTSLSTSVTQPPAAIATVTGCRLATGAGSFDGDAPPQAATQAALTIPLAARASLR